MGSGREHRREIRARNRGRRCPGCQPCACVVRSIRSLHARDPVSAVKLIIQIPCLNEREQIAATVADLPRTIEGIDTIEVLIIDDGSSDDTAQAARDAGVHHIVRFPENRGLSAAHMAGLDACARLAADIVVNTDADNQYRGHDIAALVAPILEGRADVVVGDRQTATIAHFSPLKRLLQSWGSGVVRKASGTRVRDSTSGFRAYGRKAMSRLFVHNRFTYTLETLIQAGHLGLVVENVTITTNPDTRSSRLFSSIPEYVRRNGAVILRSYGMYAPASSFLRIALMLTLLGAVLGLRFLYYFLLDPNTSAHIQSLQVGVGAIVLGFVVALMALTSDLLATNRRLSEEILARVRRIDGHIAQQQRQRGARLDGIESTGAQPWSGASNPQALPGAAP